MKKLIVFIILMLMTANVIYSQMSISDYKGKVQVLLISKNQKQWKNIDNVFQLTDNDKIRTGRESFLKLKSRSYNVIILENSIVVLDRVYKPGDSRTELYIIKGKLRVSSISLVKDENIIIRTKNSEVAPEGTDFVIDYDGFSDTSVYVFDGKVKAVNPNNPGNPVTIKGYEMSKITGNNVPGIPEDIPGSILIEYNIKPKPQLIQPTEISEPEKKIEPQPEPEMKPEPLPVTESEPVKQPEPKPEPTPAPKPEPKKEPEPEPEKEEPKEKEPWCPDPKLEFNFSFDITYTVFNEGEGEIRTIGMAIVPEIAWCKIGVGLYLPVYWIIEKYPEFKPKRSWYNYSDWNFSSPADSGHDLWIKFVYIRYGQKGDPLYIRIGGLNSVSLGNGFIMNEYSNMLNFPTIRKLGLQFDLIYNKMIGIETVIGDMNAIRLYGGRFLFFPLWFNPNLGVLNKLQIGSTAVFDRIEEHDHKVINWGLDAGLPLIETKIFNLRYGLDWATFSVNSSLLTNRRGWVDSGNYGFGTGFRGNLAIIIYRAEYRYLKDDYIPEYFDPAYDIIRKDKFYTELIYMYTNPTHSSLNGYLAQIGFSIAGAAEIGGIFQEYYDENGKMKNNKAKVYFTLKEGVIPKFYGTAAYHKFNVVGFSGEKGLFGKLYTPDTMLTFNGGIAVYAFVYIRLSYKKTFQYNDQGELEDYETYSTGLGIGF